MIALPQLRRIEELWGLIGDPTTTTVDLRTEMATERTFYVLTGSDGHPRSPEFELNRNMGGGLGEKSAIDELIFHLEAKVRDKAHKTAEAVQRQQAALDEGKRALALSQERHRVLLSAADKKVLEGNE